MRLPPPPAAPHTWPPALLQSVALCAAACTIGSAAVSAADPASLGLPGTWRLKESRAGNLCEALADFTADTPGALEGRVTVRSPCVDPGSGAWKIDFDEEKPTFGWALDYEKSRVFYSATQVEAARPGGTVKAKGVIRAAPRASPESLRPVGSFEASAKLPASPQQ